MILRRLTKHVIEQNWFAIVLDFVIVVLGILIAFQITNWSNSRQDQLIYDQARVRVIEEAQANLLQSQWYITRVAEQHAIILDILRALETCATDKNSEERFLSAIQGLRTIVSLELRKDAVNQILISDAFLDNISLEDRAMFSLYARRITAIANNSRFSDDYYLGRTSVHDIPIFKRTLGGNFDSGFAELALTVRFEDVCESTALNRFLFDRLENGTYISGLAKWLEEASRDVLVGLGESPPDTPKIENAP